MTDDEYRDLSERLLVAAELMAKGKLIPSYDEVLNAGLAIRSLLNEKKTASPPSVQLIRKLQKRIHCQRMQCRVSWEIFEKRQKSRRASKVFAIKRNRMKEVA